MRYILYSDFLEFSTIALAIIKGTYHTQTAEKETAAQSSRIVVTLRTNANNSS